jgi:FtsH-binding integral membrane protein
MNENPSVLSHQDLALARRNQVLRNTYMLLGLSLIPTLFGALLGMNSYASIMPANRFVSVIIMMVALFGLLFAIRANSNNGLGVGLTFVFTFVMGFFLAPILTYAFSFRNGAEIVMMAAGGTGAIFITMATIATVSKKDFGFMGNFLFIGLITLILMMVANIFLGLPALSLAISAAAVLLFSAMILFDVNRVVRGGETNYIMATVAIYLDLYNLFVHLLQLLLAFTGDRD